MAHPSSNDGHCAITISASGYQSETVQPSSDERGLIDLKRYLLRDTVTGATLATLFAQVALFAASLFLQETRIRSTYDHSGIKTGILYHICSILLCYTNRWSRLPFFRRTCGVKVNLIANFTCLILGILLEKFYEKSLASVCFGLSMAILFLILVVIIQPRTDLGFFGFLIGATGSVAYNLFQLKLGTWIVVAICYVLFGFKCWLDKNWLEMDFQINGNNALLPSYQTEKINSILNNPFPAPAIQSIDALMVSAFYVVWAWAFLNTNCLNSKSCHLCSAMEKLKCVAIYDLWLSPAHIHWLYFLFRVQFWVLWSKTMPHTEKPHAERPHTMPHTDKLHAERPHTKKKEKRKRKRKKTPLAQAVGGEKKEEKKEDPLVQVVGGENKEEPSASQYHIAPYYGYEVPLASQYHTAQYYAPSASQYHPAPYYTPSASQYHPAPSYAYEVSSASQYHPTPYYAYGVPSASRYHMATYYAPSTSHYYAHEAPREIPSCTIM